MDRPETATDAQPFDASVPDDVGRAVEGARVILAATDDGTEPAYVASRAVAVQLAQRAGARLLFMDRSAESMLTDPYGRGPFTSDNETWSAGEGALRRNEAEALGRHYLNEQIDVAAQAGVEARAWMPHGSGAGGDDVREALERFEVDAVVVPADPPEGLVEKLRGGWLDDVRGLAGDRPLVLVERDGSARLDSRESGS
jgi:hypothetical protein